MGGAGPAVAARAAAGPCRAARRLLPGRGRAHRAPLRRLSRLPRGGLSRLGGVVGVGGGGSDTLDTHHRLYLLARVVVARHYRQQLTIEVVAAAVSSSPRQLQRVYSQFGEMTFQDDLLARRMTAAAELLIKQRAIPVRDVARLVGYRQAPHFAKAFRRRYGLSPARFREQTVLTRKLERR